MEGKLSKEKDFNGVNGRVMWTRGRGAQFLRIDPKGTADRRSLVRKIKRFLYEILVNCLLNHNTNYEIVA